MIPSFLRSRSRSMFFSLFLFIINKGFQTIVFICIVISTTFRPICPPAFFRCLSNSGTFTELRTTSFIESTCSDSVSHNRIQALSIIVLLLTCCQDWTSNLQVIVSLEPQGTNAYNCNICVLLDNSVWIFVSYKFNVLTWLGLLLLYMIFFHCSYSDFFLCVCVWK